MSSTDFDVVIGGTKAKVLRAEDGGYRKRTLRREVEQQVLSQSENPSLVSRADQRQLYQTSWAGGARWWKPLVGPQEANSYFQSNNFDLWSEPGKVAPGNSVSDDANTSVHYTAGLVVAEDAAGSMIPFAIGSTTTEDSTHWDVYRFSSGSFVRDTGLHSGGQGIPIDMVYDPEDKYVYVIWADNELTRFKPSTDVEDAAWVTYSVTHVGASIMKHQGSIMLYLDGKLYTVDKLAPSISVVANDGMGPDFLETIAEPSTSAIAMREQINLATATPSGIYYVKNVFQGAQPVPWVFRVDKDAAGNWIVNPLSPLPPGNLALDITHHLGTIYISATPQWGRMMNNDTDNHVETVIYHYTDNQPGALGSLLGPDDEIDETPFKFLGSTGTQLFIGGHKRLWVYDAIQGGLHTAFEWPTTATDGPYRSMSIVGNKRVFLARDRLVTQSITGDDPDTVTNFGDDETHYLLTSNYFDGGLPLETKELTKVALLREAGDGDQEWTVQISADGGSFSDALVDSGTSQYAEADLSGTTGRRFQYQLIYQTKDTNRTPLEALLVTFTTGEMVTEWDLTLDGAELLNVDNEVQNEEAFYDAMVTLADTATITTLVDNMQEQGQETDTGTTTNVKVQAVEIVKEKPGESMVRVVLREAA